KEEGIVLSDDWLNKMPEENVEFLTSVNDKEEFKKLQLKTSEQNPIEENLNPGGQETLVMDFDEIENNEIIKFAPGKGQKPISLLADINAEALSFPTIYCGKTLKLSNKFIYQADITKWKTRNKDRRCAKPSILLYSYKLLQNHQIANQLSLCLRKRKGVGKPTAKNMLNDKFIESLI